MKKQFKFFFSKQYSKLFMIICFGVIVAGTIYAGSVVSDLKQDVDMKIAQKKIELDNIFDKGNKEKLAEYRAEIVRFNRIGGLISDIKLSRLNRAIGRIESGYKPDGYLMNDASYKELDRIKETSSFRLFFENFGVGWWGIIPLAVVFLINILIALIKLPTLPHNNLKHARWLSVPFFVLLTLGMFQSVWLSFVIGMILTGVFDWHSIKVKGLNRIVSILIIYSIGFFFLLLIVTKIQHEGWFWGIEFLDRRTFFDLREIMQQ